ncbi:MULTISPECIES: tyrosine-type recombinase/integrase [unclassified Microbacterium]|uniref:tyrosine-type recombinase/integrase n=1 Tax=unclassified Microbacterium TaxID=2609290 RepID=UPI000EA9DA83|nr:MULTISPECIES: tyrosine-type recombinase/integrase [unclassified Microbacterium]MBT2486650.1 tyrosine-type recombinase/integrase [Microbacterium sp. ISL-108]RKN69334.1 hypothetical protein D7252_18290 [Microbacterium sp. CGR2]
MVTEFGLPTLTRHGLRQSGATRLANPGIPLHFLQGILGHRSIETNRDTSTLSTRPLDDARTAAIIDLQETIADRSEKWAPGPGQVPARSRLATAATDEASNGAPATARSRFHTPLRRGPQE